MTSYKFGKYTIRIEQEDSPESPREWDNLGTMICEHRRYNLGDRKEQYEGEVLEILNGERPDKVALPIYMYDHGGIALSTGSFSCSFDSGLVGAIFVTKEKIRKEYNVKRITKKVLAKVEDCLRGELEIFSSYINGEVYGFIIEDENENIVDSCWGFYSTEEALEAAKEELPREDQLNFAFIPEPILEELPA